MTFRRSGPVLLTGAALLLLGLVLGFLRFVALAGTPPAEPGRRTDGIAVLTGGAERVDTGLRLLRQGMAERLLISGVHRNVVPADLVPPGLADRVILGHAATSTRGNAVEVAAWARAEHLRSLRLVTAGYHMPRALLELHRALPGVEIVPHPVVPARLRQADAAGHSRTWFLLIGEYLKLLLAWTGLSGPVTALLGTLR